MQINSTSQLGFGQKYCYIPKCKAICCSDAPLPEHFIVDAIKKKENLRPILRVSSIGCQPEYGQSVIVFTNPKRYHGKNVEGRQMWEIKDGAFNDPNYCPMLTDYGKCSVYDKRPQICRDFNTQDDFDCPSALTKEEYIISVLKDFFGVFCKKK